ncbi:MAG TPA: glycosyltransferase family 2 protein [Thermoanaerobaculia bacterium]|nr:glycosyltransferase family 2 protein [Thermoanaerobaculia bacterium]
MPPEVSAVVVSHLSAREAIDCVASLRRAFRAEGIVGEIVLVDCGSGLAETHALERGGADLFLPLAENRGYAGGVNAGLARARSFRILVCNADVVFHPDAVRTLLEAIDDPSVGAAAPLAFWDAEERVRLPAGWSPSFLSDLAQLSIGRWPSRSEKRFASFAREMLRLWDRGGTTRQLSGAVLAVRREVFDRVGRFDERFPFEFEETEWEDRVRGCGLALRFVPRARIHHLWGASATASPETPERRFRSRRLYWRRRYGRFGQALLERAARVSRPTVVPRIAQPRLAARSGAWAAISTNPSVLPFAGSPLDEGFVLPEEIAMRLPPGSLYLRSFRPTDGRPLETFVWEKEEG